MNSVIVTKTLTAAAATNICLSQTPGAAGLLTLNGAAVTAGVAVLDTARRVLLTFGADTSARSFSVVGTSDTGQTVTETVPGGATTATTKNDYKTVTAISINGAAPGTVTVGTNTTGSSPWKNVDTWANPFNVNVVCTLTGTATFSIETTNSRYLTAANLYPTNLLNVNATSIAAATASASAAITSPVRAWRLTVTAGTGSVVAEAVQAG